MAVPPQSQHEELSRVSRLYSALAQICRASNRTSDRQNLLERVCRALVEEGGFELAWIARLAEDGKKLLPEAAWGPHAEYPNTIEVYADERQEGQGPSGVAFREGGPYICNDLTQDPTTAPWQKAQREHGFRSSAAFPVRLNGHVTAVLSVYAAQVGYFRDKEIALLAEAAAEIAFSLESAQNLKAREASDAIAHQEQLFSSTLVESLPGVFYLISDRGRFLHWNQNLLTVSGYTAEELRHVKQFELFVDRDRALAKQRTQQVFDLGESSLDAEILKKDGTTERYLFTGKRIVFDGQTCLVGMGINVEHQRAAEAALRESEALNRGVLDSMLAHIAVLNRAGTITAVNEAWRNFAKENNAPALLAAGVGVNYLSVCHRAAGVSPDAHAAYEGLRALLRGERESFTLEYECSSPSVERWFLLSATPLKVPGGGATVSHLDISARKLSENLLKESNCRFELLSRAINDAVRDWDLRTNSVWWSEGFRTLFGFRPEGAAGIGSWRDRIHPDDRERVEAELQRLLQEGEAWVAQYRFRRQDSSYAHVMDQGQILRDPDGVAVRMLAGMTDITERVLLEEQLRQAQRLEAIGQLTGGVAHDFNNLLTVISGNAEWVLEHLEGNPSHRELLEIIIGAAKSGAELIEQLMAFARKQALRPVSVDSNELLAAMEPLLRRTLGAQIEISLLPSPGLWLALVDPVRLESALLNLCLNARDAVSSAGRVRIKTENLHRDVPFSGAETEIKPGDYVLITVSDNGKGISPEALPRVFDPFFTTKETGRGMGLGLAMVYGFIKQSGGHITIASELGAGTVVKMYLPRAMGAKAKIADAKERGKRGHETILLVEDEEQVRRLAARQLKSFGYRVLEARNAVEALELLARHPEIGLLFTDILMPGGATGRQLARAARQTRPTLKVLFSSGYAEEAMNQSDMDTGIQLLPKPYRRRDLGKAIRAALDAPVGEAPL